MQNEQTDSEEARRAWEAPLLELDAGGGSFERLGKNHCALLLEDGPTLLVSFESGPSLRARNAELPYCAELADESGWSSLTLISEADSWFRNPAIYGYFDRLVDDGFFDDFERVVFYGAGAGGYAAAAYSVCAPGATVVALNPQATLDPRVTEWDPRFMRHRRLDFTSRYGYAPDMLEAAEHAYVLYDPEHEYDAMHAALFTRDNVTKLRCRHLDGFVEGDLMAMGILHDIIDAACEGALDETVFYRLYRARRNFAPYLRRLLTRLDDDGRLLLSAMLCHHVSERMRMPRFRKRLKELESRFEQEGRPLVWDEAGEAGDDG